MLRVLLLGFWSTHFSANGGFSGHRLYWATDPEIDHGLELSLPDSQSVSHTDLLCMGPMGNYWVYSPAQRFPLLYDSLPVVPI
jgi:hypothetical protein